MGTTNLMMSHAGRHGGGDKGDDPFAFTVPNGEQFLSASVGWAVQNFNEAKGARIISQPAVGATGNQSFTVHWWFDGPLTPHGVASFIYTLSITTGIPGKIIVFDDIDFGGQFHLLNSSCSDLSSYGLNDKISSLVVLQGNWSFYRDSDFNAPYLSNGSPIVLGPGIYRWVGDLGIANDDLTALRAVTDAPNP